MPRVRSRVRVPWLSLVVAAAITAAGSTAVGQSRERRETGDEFTAPAVRVPYVDRPITTTRGHLSLYFGVGGEYADYYRSYPAPLARPLWGLGAQFDAGVGVTDYLELAAGVGARYAEDPRYLQYINPEREGRINREWLPSGLELVRAPQTLGFEYITNPYVRGRVALLNRRPVFVGVDLFLTLPFAANSCPTVDVGVPVHAIIDHRVRIETGVFHEFVLCEVAPQGGIATRLWSLSVPLRLLVQLTPIFWLGLRTGFDTVGYSFDARNFAVPLGLQFGVRVVTRVDLFFHVVAPEFIHTDPVTNRNVWFDRLGTGVALQAWLL